MWPTMGRALFAIAIAIVLTPGPRAAVADSSCPGNARALGTARVLEVDARTMPRVGHKHFPATLPLRTGEVVLTFDDGPWPATTPRVLDALRRECVRATFFLVGRRASAHPALARRAAAEGHTIGTHSYSHPLLNGLSHAEAESEIDRGIAAVAHALGPSLTGAAMAPFFRFPGFASNAYLLDRLSRRGLVVFGADLWASDWLPMRPEEELALVSRRLRAAGGGIVLFHDTKAHTAAMLPDLLGLMKREGYRVVHSAAPLRNRVAQQRP
jgi:peptidoglycan/xylan/chitin deacetylase (PgdA/CDA1 family)